MRILVIGAGAVGAYFGVRLVQAKRDVTFLVRLKRAEAIAAQGIQIISPHGDVTSHPSTITADRIAAPYDVILLSVKSYGLMQAMNDFAPAVGPETMIFPALNGMRHLDILAERFGEHSVLGGVCLVSTEIDQVGRIRQLADFQKLIYGERDGQVTPRLQKLDETLCDAGFETFLSTHILQDMWQKWVQLATVAAITCLLRGNVGEIAAIEGGAELSLTVLQECASIAAASGYPPPEVFLQRQREALSSESSQFAPSTYRDLRKGDPVEVDSILGDLLSRGKKLGLSTPLLQAAFVSLSIYDRGRDKAAH